MRLFVALVCGLMFSLGLGISGMTDPNKVVGFLDLFGAWDPSLALVMIGAIGVNLVPTLWSRGRGAPWLDQAFHLPSFASVDRPLLVGSALFGIGWGLSGFCPGPAVVATAAGGSQAVVFMAGMLGGMALWQLWKSRATAAQPALVPAEPIVVEAARG